MEQKVPGNYYLVECPGWNTAGFVVCQYLYDEHKGYMWIDIAQDIECTPYVIGYKALDKVGKMRSFATLSIHRSSSNE